MLVVTHGAKQDGDVSKQYQNREDLEKAYNEAKKSESRLRKILDTIPALAWCNLSDGSNDFVNVKSRFTPKTCPSGWTSGGRC